MKTMNNISETEKLFNTMLQLKKLTALKLQEYQDEKSATMLQFAALHFLNEQPGETVSNLARFLFLSKSSTTQLVERLVKAGFVEKISDTHDQRITRLSITSDGKKKLTLLKANIMDKLDSIFSKLPKKDIKELIRIHTVLIENLRHDSLK